MAPILANFPATIFFLSLQPSFLQAYQHQTAIAPRIDGDDTGK